MDFLVHVYYNLILIIFNFSLTVLNTSLKIWHQISTLNDIQSLIGRDEDLLLEFKCTSSEDGRLTNDDQRNLSKAISGFAHRDGGVIVWGIVTQNLSGVDKAISLRPIKNVQTFNTSLESYVLSATDPSLNGIESTVIFENDNPSQGFGFLVTYIPQSDGEHRSTHKGAPGFYKRFQQGHQYLPTSDIKLLFFRTFSPELVALVDFNCASWGDNTATLSIDLENRGKGIAKFTTSYLGFSYSPKINLGFQFFDSQQGVNYPDGIIKTVRENAPYGYKFQAREGVVIHPGERFPIAFVLVDRPPSLQGILPVTFHYKCYAENMIPQQGEIPLNWTKRS